MLRTLRSMEEVVLLHSNDVYEAISGHPDVFLCRLPGKLMAAPNTPAEILLALQQHNIPFLTGSLPAEGVYPSTARYNAVAAHGLFIHNLHHTDPVLEKTAQHLKPLHVKQGYVRCSLLPLPDGSFVTSDAGIHTVLQKNNIEAALISPEGITLPGFPNGFLGGTAGWIDNELVFAGNPARIADGEKLTTLLHNKHIQWRCLSDEPLFDGGGLWFV